MISALDCTAFSGHPLTAWVFSCQGTAKVELSFEVTDLETSDPLSDVIVSLVNQTGRIVNTPSGSEIVYDSYQKVITATDGKITFEDLPVAEYSYQVQADGYYAESGLVEVLPIPAEEGGGQAFWLNGTLGLGFLAAPLVTLPPAQGTGGSHVLVQLEPDPFSYTWTVVETGITDTYVLTVSITYEAQTPGPRLYVSPLVFCPGESAQFMVANMGMATMTGVQLTPSQAGVAFTPGQVAIGDLAPGQVYSGYLSSSSSDQASPSGSLNVSGQYTAGSSPASYSTSSATRLLCGDNTWHWSSEGGGGSPIITGIYEGNRPAFPGNSTPPAPANSREEARLALSGDATLERQAFLASLELTSLGEALDGLAVDIEVRDADGLAVVGGFAVTPTLPTSLGPLTAGGTLKQTWTLVPGELGIQDVDGEVYSVRAQIVYTMGGQVFTTLTLPQPITVLPQPRVKVSFSHSQPDANNEFYIQVQAENVGYGVARQLKLDLGQVGVLGDLDGNTRSLIFDLNQATLDGQPQPLAYRFDFGDLQPDQGKVGRWDIAVRANDGAPLLNPRVTSFDVGCRHLPYEGMDISSLIIGCGEVNQIFLADECPFCGIGERNAQVGGPINTANGNYSYAQGTPSIPTASAPLQLTWTYNSLNSGASPDLPASEGPLGTGWAHNYDVRLDLSGAGGPPNTVAYRAAHGTPLYFEIIKDHYRPAPGVRGALTRTEVITGQYVYTLTAPNQATYVFSDSGRLVSQLDPQGNATEFAYDPQGRLARVGEPVSGRFLDLAYDGAGRLITVSDPISRATRFGYDELGRLAVVTDTRGLAWHYDYTQLSGGPSVLSRVVAPDGRTVEQTGYDDWGRAISQTYRGQSLAIAYYPDGRRTITDGLDRETIHVYNQQGLLVTTANPLDQVETFVLDENYNRTYSEDRNGNPTYYARNALGYTTAVTDALGHIARYAYDERNNLTMSRDARGNVTRYLYDGHNNLISTTNALSGTTLYTYNDRGQVTSVTDENSQTTSYGYDALGQRTVITDALDNTTHFEYDPVGRLATTTDAAGKVARNEYDGADNLVRVTENYLPGQPQNYLDVYNIVTGYGYDEAGRRMVITDTLGRVTQNEYDAAGRLARSIRNAHPSISTQNYLDEYNLVTAYGYDAAGNQVVVTDTLGLVTRTEYDDLDRVERVIVNYVDGVYEAERPDEDIVTRYEYDDAGNPVSTFDVLGRETRTEYDELNRAERVIANYVNGVYDPARPDEDIVTRYEYDDAGNQVEVIGNEGRVTMTEYDELNRVKRTIANYVDGVYDAARPDEDVVTEYEYDDAGNRIQVTSPGPRITTYDYDDLNRVVTTTNALGGQTVATYDALGHQVAVRDANQHVTRYGYDSLGRTIVITDALGHVTRFTSDALGNRRTQTDAEGQVTRYQYDSLNRLTAVTANYVDGGPSDADTNVMTHYAYDALGRRIRVTDPRSQVSHYEYDDLGRLVTAADPLSHTTHSTYDGLGNRRSISNAAGERTEFEYDDLNRLILVRDNLGHETHYRYDAAGNRAVLVDAEGIETRYGYDDLKRLTRVIENYADGEYSGVPDEDVITRYVYDAAGNRTAVVNSRGYTSTYTYDTLGRLIEVRDPLNHATRYGYDAAGNRTVITDANTLAGAGGAVTLFVYDDANRLTDIDYSDSTPDVSFTYDDMGHRLSMLDGTGVTTYTYDSLYRLAATRDGAGQIVSYGYDAAGNRVRLTYPDGQAITYTYDAANRLDVVADWGGGVYDYTYDDANRLEGLSLPNGVESDYTYDDAGRLSLLTHSTLTETLASYTYSLDAVGNRRVLTETLAAVLDVPGAYLETGGLAVLEAERFGQVITSPTHAWLAMTARSGYTGTAYLQALPDLDALVQTDEITGSPRAEYAVSFTTPGTYTVWVRGLASNAAGDSLYLGLGEQVAGVTGLAPGAWDWASVTPSGGRASLTVETAGTYTISLRMREDGLRVDRLLLVTDTAYTPAGFGPAESGRQAPGGPGIPVMVDRVITYGYDDLYRLTTADYSTGEAYAYGYDPAGNRLQQIVNGAATGYQYDAANRLTSVNGQPYTWDANGNLLSTGAMTNTWDAANRLVAATRGSDTLEPIYNGAGDRVAQTAGVTTTYFALDVQGLPEVIYTSDGEVYPSASLRTSLHLPGVIVAESAAGERRYLLSDGLGSVRQATDESGQVVAYHEFDPYGVPVQGGGDPYGFTGEWWDAEAELLYLRARYYDPAQGRFLTQDTWQGNPLEPLSLNPYLYSMANPISLSDPSGYAPENACDPPFDGYMEGISLSYGGLLSYFTEIVSGQRRLDEIYFKYSVAVEWVYDFEHGQMALFHTVAQTFEPVFSFDNFIDLGVSLDTTHYQATVDGFGNYVDITGYEDAMWVRGINVGLLAYLYAFGYSNLQANPTDTYMTNLRDTWTAEIHQDLMTVNYTGFSASLGGSVNSFRGFAAPSLSPSGGLSMGTSFSIAVEGPIKSESSEQLARIIEHGHNSFSLVPDFLGRRVTYFNPFLIPNRIRAVKVLRTYF